MTGTTNLHKQQMLDEVAADFPATSHYTGEQHLHRDVLAAMSVVPRHLYVPEGRRDSAYFNRPLSIGLGQTISQPYIVALMTQLIGPGKDMKVLEVGTGSGYQAAILAELVDEVYSVEIVAALSRRATATLDAQGYTNVHTQVGDGAAGWPEHAPYDAIVVTAAGPQVPEALVEQLAPGGVLVLPVGEPYGAQMLTLVRKTDTGNVEQRDILPVAFVPLTSEQ